MLVVIAVSLIAVRLQVAPVASMVVPGVVAKKVGMEVSPVAM